MKKTSSIIIITFLLNGFCLLAQPPSKQNIYHYGWTDFNKNGKKDVYEDSKAEINKRIENLLAQMTLEEKTCQTATLYGYNRVLKDELPQPDWKNKIWKFMSDKPLISFS